MSITYRVLLLFASSRRSVLEDEYLELLAIIQSNRTQLEQKRGGD